MSKENIRIVFHSQNVYKAFLALDNSQQVLVKHGLERLRARGGEIGKALSGPLAGCKELKWRKHGIRLIFRIDSEGQVQIIDILAIGQRAEGRVFTQAQTELNRPAPGKQVEPF